MPLPTDEKLLALANDLLKQFDQIFGEHPGFRPRACQGNFAERHVYPFRTGQIAIARAAFSPRIDAGYGAVFEFHWRSADSGQ